MTLSPTTRTHAHAAKNTHRLREGGTPPPPGWPCSGALSYVSVTARYRPGLPPVLRNLSFHLAAGTSCGVVGRTGRCACACVRACVHARVCRSGRCGCAVCGVCCVRCVRYAVCGVRCVVCVLLAV
jgi:hypothetical protein